LAEECGLILPIGEFVLRRVFEETRDWRGVKVAINVSAVQMRTPGFAARVVQLAARAGVDPARYEIELTETALLSDAQTTLENFEILKRLGFAMVLDDFGTGYSSLSLLHRFNVDKIKIDRSFVADLGLSEEAGALVGAIVKLARSFRLGVIAEGVETDDQRQRLIAAGCGEFQGYLTGRPMALDAIEQLVVPAHRRQKLA
jgi:EAL domain-containing protein (putative c-di-GMP-specific phosphodiesterase class I)